MTNAEKVRDLRKKQAALQAEIDKLCVIPRCPPVPKTLRFCCPNCGGHTWGEIKVTRKSFKEKQEKRVAYCWRCGQPMAVEAM